MNLEVVSLEPSRRCSKGCAFCYNGSNPDAGGDWSVNEVVEFARDLSRGGVRVLSFGGGEPLEWPGIFDALVELQGTLARTLTTNGLPLAHSGTFTNLIRASPEKVHVSIHQPSNRAEVKRVLRQVRELSDAGVRSGINLLVSQSQLDAAKRAAAMAQMSGIGNERIVYLPRRGDDTPSPDAIRRVAGGPFQSMTCLNACSQSPRFASVAADRSAGWCSYTRRRRRLASLDLLGLMRALDGLGLENCAKGQLARSGLLPLLPS